VLQSGVDIPYGAIRLQLADAIGCIIHLGRAWGRRFVEQCVFVTRYDIAKDAYELRLAYSTSGDVSGGQL
jgi:hypothetical protein